MPIELFEQSLREQIANQIASYHPPEVQTLHFDRWVLASLLQKAIRRDEPEWALPAATSLLAIDPATFWRRLHVIAFEDVSFGDLALVAEILAARSKRWRALIANEWRFAAYFVDRLCKAPKCRAPNNLIEIAKYDPAVRSNAGTLTFKSSDEVLATAMIGSLPDRLMAAASLCSRSGAFYAHPDAEPESALSALLADAPALLAYSVAEGLRATRFDHPLAMAALGDVMPLVPFETADDSFPPVSLVSGIPSYTFDMHTRAGAAAVRTFIQQAPEVRRALKASDVPERGWFELVRHCIFDLETGLVKRRVVDPVSFDMRRHAEEVGYGRSISNRSTIIDAVVASWVLYTELRARLSNAS